ncbi:hypothetical protein Ccr29_gp242 [Caulobacter phage Ccr29]|uniref:Uncharacterized protein n=5 Tax=Viruses TaxID=10239 RepID=J3SML1_9CAUD|nr:hypothetical protein phiCbK_096 [Caulobacter phage phiCbK]ARB14798.1 hypothetical protein Ccr29_gp242 [Caulobacter phage Ccr29]ARB15138.1 hypothetical protein Ccr32_gp220 [Caulobacter phage Ccr32]ARB15472.1 hypothetical protein Ccr34_gp230 [Caulobacter phage Ccr34]
MMDRQDIQPGFIYRGGKNGTLRQIVSYGATEDFVCWANPHDRLPYGGFISTICTSRTSFARWADKIEEEV